MLVILSWIHIDARIGVDLCNCTLCRDDIGGVEFARCGCGRNRRRAVIDGGPQFGVAVSSLLMLDLRRQRAGMLCMGEFLFTATRLHANPAAAAVVANTRHISVVDDSRIVDIGHVDVGHVVDGRIVGKSVMIPVPAEVTDTDVAEAVVHTAIEADVITPIAVVPHIATVVPAPVTRCPERTNVGRQNPGSGHPVIIFVIWTPSPITRGPHIAVTGDGRLHIDRKFGRRNIDRNGKLRMC